MDREYAVLSVRGAEESSRGQQRCRCFSLGRSLSRIGGACSGIIRAGRGDALGAWFLCALVIVVFFLRAPLSESFWLDETISAWIIRGEMSDVWQRTLSFQGQSPLYYLLLMAWATAFGESECALRSLSLCCCFAMTGGVVALRRALKLPAVVVGLALAFLCACDVFQDALLSARPYALALTGAVWSLWVVCILLQEFSHQRAVALVASLWLTFYAHYLFAFIVVPHLFVLVRVPHVCRRIVPYLSIAALGFVPGLMHLTDVYGRAAGVSFAAMPRGIVLLKGVVPLAPSVAVVVGCLLAFIWGGRVRLSTPSRTAVGFLAPYVLWAPLPFLVFSLIGTASVWTPRYWVWGVVPLSMLVGVVLESFSTARSRRLAMVVAGAFLLLRVTSQQRIVEGWREAAAFASRSAGPMVLYSGLAEVESGVYGSVPEGEQYVRTPLLVYGVTRPVRVVGVSSSEDSLKEALDGATTVVLKVPQGVRGVSFADKLYALVVVQGSSIVSEERFGAVRGVALQ